MSGPISIQTRRLADIIGLAVVAAQATLIAEWLGPAGYRLLAGPTRISCFRRLRPLDVVRPNNSSTNIGPLRMDRGDSQFPCNRSKLLCCRRDGWESIQSGNFSASSGDEGRRTVRFLSNRSNLSRIYDGYRCRFRPLLNLAARSSRHRIALFNIALFN
jgi:hypothetical protein